MARLLGQEMGGHAVGSSLSLPQHVGELGVMVQVLGGQVGMAQRMWAHEGRWWWDYGVGTQGPWVGSGGGGWSRRARRGRCAGMRH